MASPDVDILNPTDGLASVAVICTREYVAELIFGVMSVQVLPPSWVNEIVPVPTLRRTYADAHLAAEAIPEVGCRMIAFVAVAVKVVAVLAMPSRPVAVFAAVILVFVDHAALLRSLDHNNAFVAEDSLRRRVRFAAGIGAPCQSVEKYFDPSTPAP